MIPYIKHKFFLSQTIENIYEELRILNKFAKRQQICGFAVCRRAEILLKCQICAILQSETLFDPH